MEAKSRRIASNFLKLLDFSNFCSNIHNKTICDVDTCEYEKLATGLKNFLVRNDKCEQQKMVFVLFVKYTLMYFCPIKICF